MIDDSLAFNELDLEESELALSFELELEHAPSKLSDSKEIAELKKKESSIKKAQSESKKAESEKAASENTAATNSQQVTQQQNSDSYQARNNTQQAQNNNNTYQANKQTSNSQNDPYNYQGTLSDFVNEYGVSPAYYKIQHGMSEQDALQSTPAGMKTSGEMQLEWSKYGTRE